MNLQKTFKKRRELKVFFKSLANKLKLIKTIHLESFRIKA